MLYKLPLSIQVVVFTVTGGLREYLLLRRVAGLGGFWQSVTGSLEEGETHAHAAVREVEEETGILSSESDLIDLELVNTFEISPLWRSRYAPGVTRNEEVCFALNVDKCEVRVDPREHEQYMWVCYEQATRMLYWESNKRAFAAAEKLID